MPFRLPVAVLVYTPDATLATVNAAFSVPPTIKQVKELTGLPDNEQALSLAKKFRPTTETVKGGLTMPDD
jgi:hypothetical protein